MYSWVKNNLTWTCIKSIVAVVVVFITKVWPCQKQVGCICPCWFIAKKIAKSFSLTLEPLPQPSGSSSGWSTPSHSATEHYHVYQPAPTRSTKYSLVVWWMRAIRNFFCDIDFVFCFFCHNSCYLKQLMLIMIHYWHLKINYMSQWHFATDNLQYFHLNSVLQQALHTWIWGCCGSPSL